MLQDLRGQFPMFRCETLPFEIDSQLPPRAGMVPPNWSFGGAFRSDKDAVAGFLA